MKRRILSIITVLTLVLSLCPAPARAAGTPTRTERLFLYEMQETEENAEEGWKWEPDTSTLTLTNCYIKSDNVLIIVFPDSDEAHLVLEGTNMIETSSASYNCIIASSQSGQGKLKVSGNGNLTVTAATAGISNPPYLFNGSTLTIEDGVTIHSNMDLCTINQNFTMNGGSVVLTGEYVRYGIYVNAGDVIINNGNLEIDAGVTGMFLPGIPPTTRTNNVKISGGTVNINAPVSAIHINHLADNPDGTEQIEITGGEVNLTANSRAFQGQTITVGENAKLNVRVKDGDGLSVTEGRNVTLAAGTYTGSTNAFNVTAVGAALANLLSPGYAIFNEADGTGVDRTQTSTGPGTFTVKICEHEGGEATPNNDGTTHSITCPYCGYTAEAEACTYEYRSVDDTSHKGVCVCGRETEPEEHSIIPEDWTTTYEYTAEGTTAAIVYVHSCEKECGYVETDGKIFPPPGIVEIPYGQEYTISIGTTLPTPEYRWELLITGGVDAESLDLGTESSCTIPNNLDVNEAGYQLFWAVSWDGDGGDPADGQTSVFVVPATLSGTPAFGSGEGKTLGEVEVTLPEGWPEGVLSWNLPEDTVVTANTRYEWTFTPADTANYERLGGVIVLWVQSTGGGGGGTTSSPAVTVPVSGEQSTVQVSASVSGTTATVSRIDTTQIENVIGDNGQASMVEIDFTGLGKTIDTVKLPAAAIKDIAAKAQNEEVRGLTVKLPEVEISFDAKALSAIQAQASNQITLTVTPAKPADLNSRQKEAAGSAPVFDLTLRSGSGAITDFRGGYATVSLPYTLAAGQNPDRVVVYYLDSTGNITPCTTMYDVGRKSAIFTTGHLSLYFVGYDPAAVWENPFSDVAEGAWYYDAVRYASENGLMDGYGNGKFGPNDNLSRAQFAQILFNQEGRPVVNYLLRYNDVADGAWYTEAIRWATSQGIAGGYGNGMFGPNDNITREQLAVMLWRYAGSPAATDKELYFTDADKASGYALEALRWATEQSIISGKSGGILDPKGLAARAQAAQMLKNYLGR